MKDLGSMSYIIALSFLSSPSLPLSHLSFLSPSSPYPSSSDILFGPPLGSWITIASYDLPSVSPLFICNMFLGVPEWVRSQKSVYFLGKIPSGLCQLTVPVAWLRTTCTLPPLKYQEEEAHLYHKEHSPSCYWPVLWLLFFLQSKWEVNLIWNECILSLPMLRPWRKHKQTRTGSY